MPTGYTNKIKDGISFKEFASTCAGAFGALISFRDAPSSVELPEPFIPDTYHADKLKLAEHKRYKLSIMKKKEALVESEIKNIENIAYETQMVNRQTALLQSYEAMLDNVNTWEPPTEGHNRLKEFMQEQIQIAIEHDCHTPTKAISYTWLEWLIGEIESTQWNINYHKKHHKREIQQTRDNNLWIQQLRESLK